MTTEYDGTTYTDNIADTVATLARMATEPTPVEPGALYAVPDADGTLTIISTEPWADHPHRVTDQRRFGDVEGFVDYDAGHAGDGTTVYRDGELTFVATIDDHAPGGNPGWRDHVARLRMRLSDEANHWVRHSGGLLPQAGMAEHIEERVGDIVTPDAADLLELVQFLEGTVSTKWTAAHRLRDGARTVEWSESMTAQGKVAAGGSHEVPGEFVVAVPLFRHDAAPTTLTAKVRYRVQNGALMIGYTLDRVADIINERMETVAQTIADGTNRPVFPLDWD